MLFRFIGRKWISLIKSQPLIAIDNQILFSWFQVTSKHLQSFCNKGNLFKII